MHPGCLAEFGAGRREQAGRESIRGRSAAGFCLLAVVAAGRLNVPAAPLRPLTSKRARVRSRTLQSCLPKTATGFISTARSMSRTRRRRPMRVPEAISIGNSEWFGRVLSDAYSSGAFPGVCRSREATGEPGVAGHCECSSRGNGGRGDGFYESRHQGDVAVPTAIC